MQKTPGAGWLVFPAQRLLHNTPFALVVHGGTDIHGKLFSPTPGMQACSIRGWNEATK